MRSAFVEIELDHDTGAMRGRILAGRHEGVMLDAPDVATVVAWRDILKARREQVNAANQPQPTLFELEDDRRPASQTTVAGRFIEPRLFKVD
jgi:hypothetical protein